MGPRRIDWRALGGLTLTLAPFPPMPPMPPMSPISPMPYDRARIPELGSAIIYHISYNHTSARFKHACICAEPFANRESPIANRHDPYAHDSEDEVRCTEAFGEAGPGRQSTLLNGEEVRRCEGEEVRR